MSKSMQKVTPVKIATDEVNCLAQIHRSSLSSMIAAMRMKDQKKYKKYKTDLFSNIEELLDAADKYMNESGNPALG